MKNLRNYGLISTCLLLVGFIAGCGGGPQKGELSGEVNVAGSSTVYPIATAVAQEFQKKHPHVSVSVSSTGSGGGFSNFFCPGKTDLNNASRSISKEERQQCKQNGVEPIEFQIAIDALTVVTNDENPVDCMTLDQLKQIWQPDGADRWNQVNSQWPDENFELYGAASTSGTFDYFTKVVVGEEGLHRSDYSATEHDNTIVQGVAGSRYALGYFGYAYYKENKNKVKALEIDAGNGCVEPSLKTAKSGEYPLARPLFTYAATDSLEEDQVRAFTEFFVKKSGTDLVSQIGYVPVTDKIVRRNLEKLEEASP